MCVIMSKPANVAFPEEQILKNCWDNNPDMGGFMYAMNGKVSIYKGFDTWDSFKKALDKSRAKTGDNIPYVLHFRISTQGYDRQCCQPFPLSGSMRNLKRFHTESNMGVAHNGILDITSDGSKEYSDTMKFITDYLVNIIRSYDWYKDPRTVKLIENLICGSRFAILDKTGRCTLLGKTWIEDKGCFFSNHTYSYKKYIPPRNIGYQYGMWDDYYFDTKSNSWKSIYDKDDEDEKRWADYWDKVDRNLGIKEEPKIYIDPWDKYYDKTTGMYNFSEVNCPCSMEDDDSYCECCSHCPYCSYVFSCKKACGYED